MPAQSVSQYLLMCVLLFVLGYASGSETANTRLGPPTGQESNSAHEPIRLHPQNRHYFLFRGRATVLVGSGEHYGALINSDFDYRKYLATIGSEGLNYTRLFAGSYVEVPAKSFGILRNDLAPVPGRFMAPWMRSSSPGYVGGGSRFDLDRWNPEFFVRLHDFLAEAAKRKIIVEISLFSSQYAPAQWNLSPFNSANNVNGTDAIDWKAVNTMGNGNILSFQERYARKIVREVNAFDNVIFEIQNEPFADRPSLKSVVNPYLFEPARDAFPNSIEVADPASIEWQTQVANWISGEEASLPYKHLVAQNLCDFGLPVDAVIPGVSILNFHYAFPQAVTSNYGLEKAIAYDETGFLGTHDAPYLREAWNFILSGGATFDALDYSFTVGHEDGTDLAPNGPGGGSPNLRLGLRALSDFVSNLPLVDMRPDLTAVKQSGGAYARSLSSSEGVYAIYLDGNGPAKITLDLPPGTFSGSWVNTKTGAIEGRERFQHNEGVKVLQSPPFVNGIALRLAKSTP